MVVRVHPLVPLRATYMTPKDYYDAVSKAWEFGWTIPAPPPEIEPSLAKDIVKLAILNTPTGF